MSLRFIPGAEGFSQAVSAVSQALSVETVNRVSADAVLSEAISAVSQALSGETVARVAGDNALSQAVSVVGQAISVVSQALSVEGSIRATADAALSNAVSAISGAVSAAVSAIQTVSAAVAVASALATSALGVADGVSNSLSAETVNRVSADNALSVRIDTQSQGISVLSQQISTLSNAVSAADAGLSVRIDTQSQAISIISQGLSLETAARIAGDSALSTAISALSQAVSVADAALSVRIDTQSQGLSVLSQQVSVISQSLSALSAAHLSLVNRVSGNSGTGGGGSVTSNEVSVAIGVETSNRISADNALSANIDTVSSKVSGISAILSTLRGGVTAEVLKKNSNTDFDWSWQPDVTGGAGSADVTSQKISSLSQNISAISQALSVETAARIAADSALSTAISAVSQQLSLQVSALSQVHSALSANVAAISLNVSTLSTNLSALSDAHTSLVNRVSANSVAATGSVTSNEVSIAIGVETSNRVSADNTLSAAISALSQQLSLQISALSQVLSVETANRLSAEARLSAGKYLLLQNNDASALQAGMPVILFTSANTFFRANGLGALSARNVVGLVADGSIAVSATGTIQYAGVLSLTTAQWDSRTGGTGGLTPGTTYYLGTGGSDLTTAPASGVSRTVGVAISPTTMKLHIGTGDDTASTVSDLYSAILNLSVQLSLRISAVSQAVSIVSQALSVETVNRISADNALSNVVSVLGTLSLQNVDSAAVSAGAPVYAFTSAGTFKRANAAAAGTKQVIGLVADGSIAISASGKVRFGGVIDLTTGQWDSITGGAGGLVPGTLYYLDTTAGKLTATAPATGAVRLVGIALSTTSLKIQLGTVDDDLSAISAISQALSVETAARVSADNALSTLISALSATLSTQVSALSQVHSALSANVATISLNASAISTRLSTLSDSHTSLVNRVSANSAAAAGSATSDEVSVAIAVETSNRISADNALSNLISALDILSLQNVDSIPLSAGFAVRAFTSANTFKHANSDGATRDERTVLGIVLDTSIGVSAVGRIQFAGIISLATAQWDDATGQVGGLTPGSPYYGVGVGGLNPAPPAFSPGGSPVVGVALTPTAMKLNPGGAEDWALAISAISQAISVMSNALSALDVRVGDLSFGNAVQSDAISQLVSADIALSAGHVSLVSQVSALSANVAGISTNVSAISTRLSALSDSHTSLVNRVSANSAAGPGGGSVTSAEVVDAVSVETANRVSADNALSNLISALSVQLSLQVSALSQVHSALNAAHVSLVDRVSANSAAGAASVTSNEMSVAIAVETSNRVSADNVLSTAIDAVSVELGVFGGRQMKVVATDNAITGSAVTNISGLSLSLAAGGVYQVEAQLLYNMSALTATGIGFGLSYPSMAAAQGTWDGFFGSAANPAQRIMANSTQSATGGAIHTRADFYESAAAANTNVIVLSGVPGVSAGRVYRAKMEGLFNVSAAGNMQIVAKQLLAAIVVLRGSFIRAYKIL